MQKIYRQVTDKSSISKEQVKDKLGMEWDILNSILSFCATESRANSEIIVCAGFKDRATFMKKFIKPMIEEGLLAMTVPDKPNSRLQKYYTTEKGKSLLCPDESN